MILSWGYQYTKLLCCWARQATRLGCLVYFLLLSLYVFLFGEPQASGLGDRTNRHDVRIL